MPKTHAAILTVVAARALRNCPAPAPGPSAGPVRNATFLHARRAPSPATFLRTQRRMTWRLNFPPSRADVFTTSSGPVRMRFLCFTDIQESTLPTVLPPQLSRVPRIFFLLSSCARTAWKFIFPIRLPIYFSAYFSIRVTAYFPVYFSIYFTIRSLNFRFVSF